MGDPKVFVFLAAHIIHLAICVRKLAGRQVVKSILPQLCWFKSLRLPQVLATLTGHCSSEYLCTDPLSQQCCATKIDMRREAHFTKLRKGGKEKICSCGAAQQQSIPFPWLVCFGVTNCNLWDEISVEAQVNYLNGITGIEFTYSKELKNYLHKNVWCPAIDLEFAQAEFDALVVGDERSVLIRKAANIKKRLRKEMNSIDDVFRPYLHLGD